MLPVIILQLFVASASAAALTIQIQNPFDLIFGDRPYPRPHPNPGATTIYEAITGDGRFSYLSKAIKFVGDDIINVLNCNDADHHISFFAVPDSALRRSPHDHDDDFSGDDEDDRQADYSQVISTAVLPGSPFDRADVISAFGDSSLDLSTILSAVPDVAKKQYSLLGLEEDDDGDDDGEDDDPDREKRKKVIRFIVNAILQYHVLPFPTTVAGLRENNTYSTYLKVPVALGGHHQRVRVENRYKKKEGTETYLNHFSKVVVPDVEASNGYIHVVDHPIIPPASAFQELFSMQGFFSTFTSALQRTGLTDDVDLRYVFDEGKDEGHFEGSAVVTVFAVPDKAFQRLPKRLRLFLFSPFGASALRKLLEYHIVPGAVVHSDYFHNQTAETEPDGLKHGTKFCTCGESELLKKKKKKKHPHREPISSTELDLDTRFFNHSIHWVAEKSELTFPGKKGHTELDTEVFVNGRKVAIPDIIAVNGAVHVLDRIMCPWQHDGDGGHHHHGEHGEARHGMLNRYHGHHDGSAADYVHKLWDDQEDDIWKGWEERLPRFVAGH